MGLYGQGWEPETKPIGVVGLVHGLGEHSGRYEHVAATNVEGVAKDINFGVLAGGFMRAAGMGGGLSGFAKTPMEKAIRTCIDEAVKFLVKETPKEYLKY